MEPDVTDDGLFLSLGMSQSSLEQFRLMIDSSPIEHLPWPVLPLFSIPLVMPEGFQLSRQKVTLTCETLLYVYDENADSRILEKHGLPVVGTYICMTFEPNEELARARMQLADVMDDDYIPHAIISWPIGNTASQRYFLRSLTDLMHRTSFTFDQVIFTQGRPYLANIKDAVGGKQFL